MTNTQKGADALDLSLLLSGTGLDLSDLIPKKTKGLKSGSSKLYAARKKAIEGETKPHINPFLVWTPTKIIIGLHHTKCTNCGSSHSIPNPPLVEWTRPHRNQTVTCTRFPANWQDLPRTVTTLSNNQVNGCHICMQFSPDRTWQNPVTDDLPEPPEASKLPNELQPSLALDLDLDLGDE